ncbi:uncharacterized protein TNCV_3195671 [Trichonephila clavipes]|nr:uncharacterized protein TNCV_3195671 [Trichonephila clavipes]
MSVREYAKAGTLPLCTIPHQNIAFQENNEITNRRSEDKGQRILLESLSHKCPDIKSHDEVTYKDKYKDFCHLFMHEMTSANPIRRYDMVPGYTGFIPGKSFSCGETYSVESRNCTESFLIKNDLTRSFAKDLTKGITNLPSYFEVWYEIPRKKFQRCLK